jgi:hypothetical protein
MAIYCALCGANIALVGRAHRCIPRADAQPDAADDDAADAAAISTSVTHGVTQLVTHAVTHGGRSKAAARQAKHRQRTQSSIGSAMPPTCAGEARRRGRGRSPAEDLNVLAGRRQEAREAQAVAGPATGKGAKPSASGKFTQSGDNVVPLRPAGMIAAGGDAPCSSCRQRFVASHLPHPCSPGADAGAHP